MRYQNRLLLLVPMLCVLTLPACQTTPTAVACPVLPSFPVELMQPARNQFLLVAPDSSKTPLKTPQQ